jgi:DNA-binding XRE family transcriptional regulator
MNAPQIIRTPAGEEMVVISRADYDALVRIAEDAEEDAADVAAFDEGMAALAADGGPLTPGQTGALLAQRGWLRAIRKAKGMTQAELSALSGVGQGFISDLESGRRHGARETLVKLARALDIPFDEGAVAG